MLNKKGLLLVVSGPSGAGKATSRGPGAWAWRAILRQERRAVQRPSDAFEMLGEIEAQQRGRGLDHLITQQPPLFGSHRQNRCCVLDLASCLRQGLALLARHQRREI